MTKALQASAPLKGAQQEQEAGVAHTCCAHVRTWIRAAMRARMAGKEGRASGLASQHWCASCLTACTCASQRYSIQ